MTKHNEENERLKRRYFTFLREAKRYSEASVDVAAKAIERFDAFNGRRSFKGFHHLRAVAFKRRLAEEKADRTGKPLSQSTLESTLRCLVAFFKWLADQPGFKSQFTYSDAEHFNLPHGESRAGRARGPVRFPTLDQLHRVLSVMPHATDIEKRDRALIALAMLTGARDGALRSLRCRHIRLDDACIDQDPREVATKFSKHIVTWFFPVGGDAAQIAHDWVGHLRHVLLWGDNDPLFPATKIIVGKGGGFVADGLERKSWSTASPIRRIFREAFESAGLPYFHPHALRHTLSKLGTQVCRTPEEIKCWSQNLGHEHVLTTLTSYGAVSPDRQSELIRAMQLPSSGDVARLVAAMRGQI